jgi:hypothetical protein
VEAIQELRDRAVTAAKTALLAEIGGDRSMAVIAVELSILREAVRAACAEYERVMRDGRSVI